MNRLKYDTNVFEVEKYLESDLLKVQYQIWNRTLEQVLKEKYGDKGQGGYVSNAILLEKYSRQKLSSDNQLLVLSGPGGVGKGKVRALLTQRGYSYVPNVATRPPRQSEIDGIDYYFWSKQHFELSSGELVAIRQDKEGYQRGFPLSIFEQLLTSGNKIVLEKMLSSWQELSRILVQNKLLPDYKLIFLLPSHPRQLTLQIINRSIVNNASKVDISDIERGLSQYNLLEETLKFPNIHYVVNRNLDNTVEKIMISSN